MQIKPETDRIILTFKACVDYQSSNAGKLIHNYWNASWHYYITISDTHVFNFGGNGFAVFPIPSNTKQVTQVKLLNKKEVLDRCLIAFQLFKDWHYGLLGWNCEHFARLVTTSEAVSYQVKESPLAWLNHNGYHPLAMKIMNEAYLSYS
ncbi:hypothetical protein [Floridanema evergladense]|uniref:LRAT domain-containing protein n=1 Tax=Floridaenema evergladense BLCC-F167 TaxID=3153639 RepID=A0ABV4WHD6_9CYAN